MTHREPWRVSTKNGLDSQIIPESFVFPSLVAVEVTDDSY